MTNVQGILHRSPFSLDVIPITAPEGLTIEEILRQIPNLPKEIWEFGVIKIGEFEILRENWGRVRPKAGSRHLIRIGVRVAGGGGGSGGGGKNIFATIATIALLVVVTAITQGAFGPEGLQIAGGLFAAGSTSATLAAAGVAVLGALAINALTPSPVAQSPAEAEGTSAASLGQAGFRANSVGLYEPIPFVTGTHRVAPPHLTPPWTESVNDDQYVNAIVGLNGPHRFQDIRVNGSPIENFDDITVEIRDVINDDTDVTIIDKQVFEEQLNTELPPHKLNDDATDELQDDAIPENSYPVWVGFRSRSMADEIWLTFVWSGLIRQVDAGGTDVAGIAIRMRIRRSGDTTWINLPEFHAQRERLEAFRGMIKLVFQPIPNSLTRLDQNQTLPPWKYALDIDNGDNGEGFAVDSYFAASVANNADGVGSEGGIAVVYLDPATFPKGNYEVQVMRGYGYDATVFTPSTYVLNSLVPYFFSHIPASSPATIRQEQSKVLSKVSVASFATVWNEYPLGEKGMSLIAIRAKNVNISSLTVEATGYANVWDGTDWNTVEPTKNAAAIWRYLALGGQSVDPVFVEAQLSDDDLTDWYDFCGDERTVGVAYDGTTSFLTRDAGLTGAADGKEGTFSAWIKITEGHDSGAILASVSALAGGSGRTRFTLGSGTREFQVIGVNSSNTTILDIISTIELPAGVWNHVLCSYDLTDTGNRHLYVNDADNLTVNTYTNDTIDYTLPDWGVGGLPDGSGLFEGSLAEVWFEPTYIDLSIEANRRKFISANGRPVDLGADGSTPTGSAPIVYLKNDETNLGDGEGFTLNGTVTDDPVNNGACLPNRECNALFQGRQSLSEVLRIVAATGTASSRVSDKIGVVIDDDRTDESAVAVFSQRNSRNLTMRRAFPRIPDALRIRFNDETNDYTPTEIFAFRKFSESVTIVEAADYVGITRESAARDLAQRAFKQLLRRPTLFNLEVDATNLYCVKGSIVSLVHDTIRRHYDSARVLSATISGGNLTSLALDSALRLDLIGDAVGVVFDGTNDYLDRGAGLTGASDSKLFAFAAWLFVDSSGSGERWILSNDGTNPTRIFIDTDNSLRIVAANAADTTILDMQTSPLTLDRWVHVVVSIDLADIANRHIYVDDTSDIATVTTYTDDTIDFTKTDWFIGAEADTSSKFKGGMAELFFETDEYIDLSVEANRRLFYSLHGRPANLGSDGSTPLGVTPLVYLSGSFETNLGGGGDFTLTGALSTSSVFYSESGFPAGIVAQWKDGSTLTAQIDEETLTSTVTFSTPQPLPSYLADQGSWTTSTGYSVDDVVTNGGAAYSAIADHTSGASNEPGVGTDWNLYWEPLLEDCLVACGPFASTDRRMIVLGIKPQNEFTAMLTLVEEAPPCFVTGQLGTDDIYGADGTRITTQY